jgi:hypothetical protein
LLNNLETLIEEPVDDQSSEGIQRQDYIEEKKTNFNVLRT